jgi:hypothetical protein
MNPNTIQLVTAILQAVIQLAYVFLTGYGIRQGFVYMTKRLEVLGESERMFARRAPESAPPADLSLGLRDK